MSHVVPPVVTSQPILSVFPCSDPKGRESSGLRVTLGLSATLSNALWAETWHAVQATLKVTGHLIYWLPLSHILATPISAQFSSVAQSCPTLCDPMNRSMPGFPVHHHSWSLPKLMSIESVMPSNHLILCHPLLLLPSIFPRTRVFSNESALCIWWPKYRSFSFNISPSNEHPGLISLQSKGLSRVLSNTTVQKHQFFGA